MQLTVESLLEDLSAFHSAGIWGYHNGVLKILSLKIFESNGCGVNVFRRRARTKESLRAAEQQANGQCHVRR